MRRAAVHGLERIARWDSEVLAHQSGVDTKIQTDINMSCPESPYKRCDAMGQIRSRDECPAPTAALGPQRAWNISLNHRDWGIRLSCLTGVLVQVPGPVPVARFDLSVRSPGEIPISLVSVN